MFEVFDKSIEFVALEDVNDTDVESGVMDLTWDGIQPHLKTHDHRKNKYGRCFIPAKFKPRDEWVLSDSDKKPSFRNDANIESISMAVLDLDTPGAREKAEALFKDYEYIIYSTHSYTRDTPYKFRIVLKLNESIQGNVWPEYFNTLIAQIDADKSCGNLSRVFYFPSHNPSARIRPYVHHNDGKTMSHEDIKGIKRDYEASLTPEERDKFNSITNPSSAVGANRGKRHMSGEFIPFYELSNNSIDLSYEGMKSRLKDFLPILIDADNRHDFAMRVSSSEVAKHGSRVDIFQLVQFIYKASTEYGTKPLTDHSGDTRKELPELISSAVSKYAPDLVSGENPHFKDLRSYVREVVTKVEQLAITDSWSFPTKPRKYNPMEDARKQVLEMNKSIIDNSQEGWRTRHIGSMRHLVKTGDLVSFAQSVAHNELRENGADANINVMGQFIFYCLKGYYTKVASVTDVPKALKVGLETLEQNLESIIPENKRVEDDKITKFVNTSFKIARVSATKNEWRFGPKTSPENVSQLTS